MEDGTIPFLKCQLHKYYNFSYIIFIQWLSSVKFYGILWVLLVNNVINLHNSNSKSLNRVEVRAGLRPILKFDQVHTKWPIEFGKFTVNSQVYRWWTNHRTMRAQSQNLQSAKFWWWWIQLLLFTPTSYDCTRTGRQLWQSVTSNNANNSNDQHLQQHF